MLKMKEISNTLSLTVYNADKVKEVINTHAKASTPLLLYLYNCLRKSHRHRLTRQ